MERNTSSRETMVYSQNSFICSLYCQVPHYRALLLKEQMFGHHPLSPTWMEGLHKMRCGLVPHRGSLNDTAISTPVPCSLQHDTFQLGLGRPESH
jgi:hypothetical protein